MQIWVAARLLEDRMRNQSKFGKLDKQSKKEYPSGSLKMRFHSYTTQRRRHKWFFRKHWNSYWLMPLKELTVSWCFERNRYSLGMWKVLVCKTGCFLLNTGKASAAFLGLLWGRQSIEEGNTQKKSEVWKNMTYDKNQRIELLKLEAKNCRSWQSK